MHTQNPASRALLQSNYPVTHSTRTSLLNTPERRALEVASAGNGTELLHELPMESKEALLSWAQAHAVLLQVS